jgi:hypothetical protein
MTKLLGILAALLLALPASAQTGRDQLLAPIAAYPRPLQSLVIRAARFPVDIIEAAQWLRANPGLRGGAAVRAAQIHRWDPSVKALLAYPDVVLWMDDNLEWTRRVGEAFAVPPPAMAYAPAPPPATLLVARPMFYPTYAYYRPQVVVTRIVPHVPHGSHVTHVTPPVHQQIRFHPHHAAARNGHAHGGGHHR